LEPQSRLRARASISSGIQLMTSVRQSFWLGALPHWAPTGLQ
jgi:hypothetical protein